MRSTPRAIASLTIVLAIMAGGAAAASESPDVVRLMVLTETNGFRHSSIDEGLTMLQTIAATETFSSVDFTVTAVSDSVQGGPGVAAGGAFTDGYLANFDVLVFISTTSDVLSDPEQAAFERFVQAGGGYVGIHAAADSEYGWPWYGDFLGGQFVNHPAIQQATVNVEDASQASTIHLPQRWTRTDEWYNYRANPREFVCHTRPDYIDPLGNGHETEYYGVYVPPFGAWTPLFPSQLKEANPPKECGVHVLMTLDETTYNNTGTKMGDHPIAWCNEWDGGRAWYTALGHTEASFVEPAFITHVIGGLLTASGIEGLADSPDFAHYDEDGNLVPVSFDCEPDAAA